MCDGREARVRLRVSGRQVGWIWRKRRCERCDSGEGPRKVGQTKQRRDPQRVFVALQDVNEAKEELFVESY